MARDWESVFTTWAQPPSDTEKERADNAVRMIKAAIAASSDLSSRSIRVFLQGSYANRTNVRRASDVDVCVCCSDTIFSFGSVAGFTYDQVGVSSATYPYSQFKNEVSQALAAKFGTANVRRGNKAFEVQENTYRVEADVVPTFVNRSYYSIQPGAFTEGTGLVSDLGETIANWPDQNYANGVAKNTETGRSYKPLVRIFKRLRNEMADEGDFRAQAVPGFLLECLLWNIPNNIFNGPSYKAMFRGAMAYLGEVDGSYDEAWKKFVEVNDQKWLFHSTQRWTWDDVMVFLRASWSRFEGG